MSKIRYKGKTYQFNTFSNKLTNDVALKVVVDTFTDAFRKGKKS